MVKLITNILVIKPSTAMSRVAGNNRMRLEAVRRTMGVGGGGKLDVPEY